MATKSAKPKRLTTKRKPRQPKADKRAVKEYEDKYQAFSDEANKVLAAKELMERAGGFKEAFILLDAVLFAKIEKGDTAQQSEDEADDTKEKCDKIQKQCEVSVRKVLAAETLMQLTGGYMGAFWLLNAVTIAVEGGQGCKQLRQFHSAAVVHHQNQLKILRHKILRHKNQ